MMYNNTMNKTKKILKAFCVFFVLSVTVVLSWCIKTKNPSTRLLHNSEINLQESDAAIIEKDNLVLIDNFIPTHQKYKIDGDPEVFINGVDFKVVYSLLPKHGLNIVAYSRKYDKQVFNKLKRYLFIKYGFPYFSESREIKWNIGGQHSKYIVVLTADEEYLMLSMETRNMVK